MAINFPTSLDTLPKPANGQAMNQAGAQAGDIVSDLALAIEALQVKVGANTSAVATSLDYFRASVRGTGGIPAGAVNSSTLSVGSNSSGTSLAAVGRAVVVAPNAVNDTGGGVTIVRYRNASAAGPDLEFAKSQTATIGGHNAVAAGSRLGAITWAGSDGTAFQRSAEIRVDAHAAATAGVVRSRVIFSGSDAAGVMTEYMRSVDGSGIQVTGPITAGGIATIVVVPDGAGASVTPLIQAAVSSGVAALSAYIADGTNNRRAALFVDQPNGLWGLSHTALSGLAPFVIRFGAGVEGLRVSAAGAVNALTSYSVAGNQVLGTRKTGWAAATGTATRSTFATGSVTLPQLAERVKALIDDFLSHGSIGA
jgi:hypothetical protein